MSFKETLTKDNTKDNRKCLVCGYEGQMKTWLSNHFAPILILVILLFCWLVPGIIFMIWCHGKFKCPSCGTLGKNVKLTQETSSASKKCPYCAETIKLEAVVCRYCQKQLV